MSDDQEGLESDSTAQSEPAVQGQASGAGTEPEARLRKLERRARRHMWWLIAVSAFTVLVLGAVAVFGWFMAEIASDGMFGPSGRKDQSAEIEKSVRDAYGSDLASVKVRRIKEDIEGEVPFPFRLLVGDSALWVYTVEYRLTDAAVPFGGTVSEGSEIGVSGLLPVRGSLRNRLTVKQVRSLLKAYATESDKPVAAITAYGDPEMPDPTSGTQTLKVSGKTYRTDELWRVSEGFILGPKETTLPEDMFLNSLDVIVRMDPKTGATKVLGTEPGGGGVY